MTSLHAIGTYLPARSVAIDDHLGGLGLAENVELYQRYYGFGRIRREPSERLADQLCAAALDLAELRGREKDVRYIVHAPTIQVTAPYPGSPVRAVRQALGLTRALPFSLTQHACASALLAIDACGKLLAADHDPDALALVLAGEKTFTRVAQLIPHSAIMGEAAAAVLVSAAGDRDRLLSYAARTLGEFNKAPYLPPPLEEKFQNAYTETLLEVIQAAIGHAGLTIDDAALILPHNVNRMSWLRIMRRLRLPKDRLFLDNQAQLGHCFGADSFIAHRTARELGRLRRGDHYVMTAAGLGATLAAMVFQH